MMQTLGVMKWGKEHQCGGEKEPGILPGDEAQLAINDK